MRDFSKDVVDIDYLLDAGLLFEINRSILHLFGLAITVKVAANGDKSFALKDSRAEPEKLTFDKNLLSLGRTKLENFQTQFGHKQMNRRVKKLGVGCQHVECWTGK